jgi:hypothetical protein
MGVLNDMTKKVLIVFTTLALAVASAASSYRITLFQKSEVGGKQLKPGEYKMSLQGDKVTLTQGKQSVEATVKVESSETKFGSTTIRYIGDESNARIQEIRIGGTNTKVVFN